MIKIIHQGYISELGKRANNEDNYGYNEGSTYVVCDGVGGSEKGEVASDITVRCFIEFFKVNPNADANEVLKIAEAKLSGMINQNPETVGMATTLTLSQVRENGIYVVWCGDSRVYQFRDGQILFQTIDHSWVNEAVKAGIITSEEAINHPKSNVITRAIQGTIKPTQVDTVFLTDIKKGDFFLHCSDGVLESWTDDDLIALFSTEKEPTKILEKIKAECEINSRDNFTAIVYRIEETDIVNSPKPVEAISLETEELITHSSSSKGKFSKMKEISKVKIPLWFFLVILIPLFIFGYLKNKHTNISKIGVDNPENAAQTITNPVQQPVVIKHDSVNLKDSVKNIQSNHSDQVKPTVDLNKQEKMK
ncbi:MAG: serine/threonine-protein phosphatase [Prolixibacteraceae bacterium]|nr:serine/threonine-protein phosphatase [Prolixibacteraceae bacterium]